MAVATFGDDRASLFVACPKCRDVALSLFVLGATFGNVAVPPFVAGAGFGDVAASLFVALGATFPEPLFYSQFTSHKIYLRFVI